MDVHGYKYYVPVSSYKMQNRKYVIIRICQQLYFSDTLFITKEGNCIIMKKDKKSLCGLNESMNFNPVGRLAKHGVRNITFQSLQ